MLRSRISGTPADAAASVEPRDLEGALSRLPDEQRQVILLVGLEGLRYDEVSAILGSDWHRPISALTRAQQSADPLMEWE